MKRIFVIIATSITLPCTAQQYAAKAYLNISNSTLKNQINVRYQNQAIKGYNKDYIYPSIALNFKNKHKNQHEIELNSVNISNIDLYTETTNAAGNKVYFRSQSLTTTFIRLRYEYILCFNKKQSMIEPSVGFGALAYYERENAIPYESSNYPISSTYIGNRFMLTPRVNINISKRIFADINIPFCIIDASIAKQNIANPAIPIQAQRYSIADVELFPRYYSLRIGAGLRI